MTEIADVAAAGSGVDAGEVDTGANAAGGIDTGADAAGRVAAGEGEDAEAGIAEAAVAWFDEHARDLPWRHADATAWGILVSEIMLQQTPVPRVLPAWTEWMRRWPTPAALADAEPAEAIRMWGRLGYPRRALRLHECAVALVARHGGVVPSDPAVLGALPGIGIYTAAAVAAFAYGRRVAVVDTNVRRFVARVAAGEADAGPATTPADLRAVTALLPAEPARAARASAAFMEIGAVLCVARAPHCTRCPLRDRCAWLRAGAPPATGPTRRPQAYAGTDRQIRGRLLAILREADGAVPVTHLDPAWPDAARRVTCLASLVTDGLAVEVEPGHYALGPGRPEPDRSGSQVTG